MPTTSGTDTTRATSTLFSSPLYHSYRLGDLVVLLPYKWPIQACRDDRVACTILSGRVPASKRPITHSKRSGHQCRIYDNFQDTDP